MANKEENRRKDICIKCKDFKPIKAKDQCQNCWSTWKRHNRPDFFLKMKYTQILQRCINKNNSSAKNYYGKSVCTREEFFNKFKNDETFLKTYEIWRNNNFDIKYCPSIDRIDNNRGYDIDNIQVLTHSENCKKDQIRHKINVYSKNGEFIGTYESATLASKVLNVPQSNIWKVLKRIRKFAGGYRFEYA